MQRDCRLDTETYDLNKALFGRTARPLSSSQRFALSVAQDQPLLDVGFDSFQAADPTEPMALNALMFIW